MLIVNYTILGRGAACCSRYSGGIISIIAYRRLTLGGSSVADGEGESGTIA